MQPLQVSLYYTCVIMKGKYILVFTGTVSTMLLFFVVSIMFSGVLSLMIQTAFSACSNVGGSVWSVLEEI